MAKRKKVSKEAFVVVRRGWEEGYGDDWSFSEFRPEEQKRVLGRPLVVCADKDAAGARAEELEREARQTLNPFLFVGPNEYTLRSVTSLTAKQFTARLKKLFPESPPPGKNEDEEYDWYGWWAGLADRLSEEQRAAVWELLDRLKFYGVMEAKME